MEEVNELKAALERSSSALAFAQAAEKQTLEELRHVREQIEEDEIRIEEARALLQTSHRELLLTTREVAVAESVGRELRLREEDISRQHELVVSRVHERTGKFQKAVQRQKKFIQVLVEDMTAIRVPGPETALRGDWREAAGAAAQLREESQELLRRRALASAKEESFLLAEINKVELATQEKRGRRLRVEEAVSRLPYLGAGRATSTSVQVQTHSLEVLQTPACGQSSPPARSQSSQRAFTTPHSIQLQMQMPWPLDCAPVSPEPTAASRKRPVGGVAAAAGAALEAPMEVPPNPLPGSGFRADAHARMLKRRTSWTASASASGEFYAACDEEQDEATQG